MGPKLRLWGVDITGAIAAIVCWFSDLLNWLAELIGWFTPAHCDHLAKIIAVCIGMVTLFFITLPKAWPNIRKIFKGAPS